MKKVLFIGLTDYDLFKEEAVLRKKWEGLSRDAEVYIIARGQGFNVRKYLVSFYLFPKILGRLSIFFWVFFAFFTGLYLILTKRIDVIISQSPTVEGFVATWLSLLTRRKLVIEVHGDFVNGPFHYYHVPFEETVKKILKSMGRFSLRSADTVRVISEATRLQVVSFAPNARIVKFIAYTDVDHLLKVQDISWNPTIVFVGALYRIKGVHTLIAACIRIREKFPEIQVEIYGKGPLKEELEAMAKPLGSAVIFHGFRPLGEIEERLKHAAVLVLPSLSEGLGRVLVEAGALAKPLIGSNVGGIPEIIQEGENGYLVEPENVDELAFALTKILGDPEHSAQMGQVSRRMVQERFSTEHFFVGYRNMINSL